MSVVVAVATSSRKSEFAPCSNASRASSKSDSKSPLKESHSLASEVLLK